MRTYRDTNGYCKTCDLETFSFFFVFASFFFYIVFVDFGDLSQTFDSKWKGVDLNSEQDKNKWGLSKITYINDNETKRQRKGWKRVVFLLEIFVSSFFSVESFQF